MSTKRVCPREATTSIIDVRRDEIDLPHRGRLRGVHWESIVEVSLRPSHTYYRSTLYIRYSCQVTTNPPHFQRSIDHNPPTIKMAGL